MSYSQNGAMMDTPSELVMNPAQPLAAGSFPILAKNDATDSSLDATSRPGAAIPTTTSASPPVGLGPQPSVQPGLSAYLPAFSRTWQFPAWPLRGNPSTNDTSSNYKPPVTKSAVLPQPGPRTPRFSQEPSLYDSPRTPKPLSNVLASNSPRDSVVSNASPGANTRGDTIRAPPRLSSSSSRPSTLSSVGTIPDFPVPAPSMSLSRRSITLGPPPSARRGTSSFYSSVPFVSPIPEESPRTRSRTSYASSAAMPDAWTNESAPHSPDDPNEAADERGIRNSSRYSGSHFGDESQLVRSASVGKRAMPALVMTQSPPQFNRVPVDNGLSDISPVELQPRASLFANRIGRSPQPISVPLHHDPSSTPQVGSAGWRFSRLSSLRKPPHSSTPPGRGSDFRGSTTSLPDLIRRATRLASMMDKGRRPTSDLPPEDWQTADEHYIADGNVERISDANNGFGESLNRSGYQSSHLSDMINAFPPPGQAFPGPEAQYFPPVRRQVRGQTMLVVPSRSHLRAAATPDRATVAPITTAWPFPEEVHTQRLSDTSQSDPDLTTFRKEDGSGDNIITDSKPLSTRPNSRNSDTEKRIASDNASPRLRRCCGLPLWAFIVLAILVAIAVAAAIVVPLQVLRNRPADANDRALEQCRSRLTCRNGGSIVVVRGLCACICTNGFTGSDCTSPATQGCAVVTVDPVGTSNIVNATLGQTIPRLLESANRRFAVPLAASAVLSKFNNNSLSCMAQNILVMFNGIASANGIKSFAHRIQRVTITIDPGRPATVTQSIAIDIVFSTTILVPSTRLVDPPLLTSTRTRSASFTTSSPITTSTRFTSVSGNTSVVFPIPSPPTQTFLTSSFPPVISISLTTLPQTSSRPSSLVSGLPTTTTMITTTTQRPVVQRPGALKLSDDVVDFGRIVVLYILQEEDLENASRAQNRLQQIFEAAEAGTVTELSASNVTISDNNTVDLVNFRVDLGNGLIGQAPRR